jgi:hypothetical protein
MRLDELIGIKRYRQRDFWDVLRDFEAAGGEFLGSGKYASVIGTPRWNFVYKFFKNDPCYLDYVEWCRSREQHPCMPRFLAAPRWIVPFYRRHKSEGKRICIVKLERLRVWTPPPEINDSRALDLHLTRGLLFCDAASDPMREAAWRRETEERILGRDRMYGDDKDNQQILIRYLAEFEQFKAIWSRHPELLQLTQFYGLLLKAPVECALDIHRENVMQRADGTLVMTDPFWAGYNIYAAHDEMMRAETGAYDEWDPPEHEYYPGGSEELPKPPEPEPWEPDEGDIPF